MHCIKCQHGQTKRFGYAGKQRIQRYRCTFCKSTFVEPRVKPLDRHYTPLDKATQVLALMLEGCSVRAIERLTGVHRDTILALMCTAGEKAATAFDSLVRNVHSRHVEADEVWCFTHTKEAHLRDDDPGEWGHTYTWIALCADSKLVLSYHVGKRGPADAFRFIEDLDKRVKHHFQLTTDGHGAYREPIETVLGMRVDYATLVKVFSTPKNAGPDWYGTGKIRDLIPSDIIGSPDPEHISTSYVERSNLTLRMHLRRFTRLTNGFSKKLDNLKAAVSLYMAWYNFCRVHSTLKVTPAMEAGLTDHVWNLPELLSNP
ncbi:MAG: IS1 family transposase [Candidatus Korobacteraceae bacterium]